jgi:hypothetical protein
MDCVSLQPFILCAVNLLAPDQRSPLSSTNVAKQRREKIWGREKRSTGDSEFQLAHLWGWDVVRSLTSD